MNDDYPTDEALRAALHHMPMAEPSPDAMPKAVAEGLAAFDAALQNNFQGSAPPPRPIPAVKQFLNLLGEWRMNTKRITTLSLLATTSLLALVLWPRYEALRQQPLSVNLDEAAPAAVREETPAKQPRMTVGISPAKGDQAKEKKAEGPAALATAGAPPPQEAVARPMAPPPPPLATAMPSVMAKSAMNSPTAPGGRAPVVKAEPAPFDLAMQPAPASQELERDKFHHEEPNPVQLTSANPVSTFSVDVDTASYAFVRARINTGVLPPPDAVRVEEMVNYFDYDYSGPKEKETPFATTVKLYPTPWNTDTRLMHIGIQGYDLTRESKPRSNLVFLVDVSGSMNEANKLPLLKKSLALLVDTLQPEDTVAIAVYAGAAGVVLESTPVKERAKILASLDKLQAGGSTAGGEGIRLAYSLAEGAFDKQAVNRVILATDGDFNVGVADVAALKGMVARYRKSGVFLSVLGFGQGNYNDQLMQTLAQNGNGVAAYIDTLNEAQKVLVSEAAANLFPIAKDVKIQVEFNPAKVAEYRLIGYETRRLNREDFNNDQVDAGEIGAGHRVTALYEVALAGSAGQLVEPLRYGGAPAAAPADTRDEFAFLKIRYKLPDGESSRLINRPVTTVDLAADLAGLPDDLRFAAAVAAFGQKLTGGRHLKNFGYEQILTLANGAKGKDPFGYRGEFVSLVRLAKSLDKR